jgi:hypothetical protein
VFHNQDYRYLVVSGLCRQSERDDTQVTGKKKRRYDLRNLSFVNNIVTYKPIARQRLSKHIPAEANTQ